MFLIEPVLAMEDCKGPAASDFVNEK